MASSITFFDTHQGHATVSGTLTAEQIAYIVKTHGPAPIVPVCKDKAPGRDLTMCVLLSPADVGTLHRAVRDDAPGLQHLTERSYNQGWGIALEGRDLAAIAVFLNRRTSTVSSHEFPATANRVFEADLWRRMDAALTKGGF